MRWLALYAAMGIVWQGANIVLIGPRFPRFQEQMRSGIEHVRIATLFAAGQLLGLAIWPLAMFWTIFPFAFGETVKTRLANYLRRRYIDSDKWQAVLADPVGCHPPALGCNGHHPWGADGCPCIVKCEACGCARMTSDCLAAMGIPKEDTL